MMASTDTREEHVPGHRGVFVLVNPRSSRSDPKEIRELAESGFEGGAVELRVMEHADDAAKVVALALAERRPDLVLVAGGDGTVSAAASGLSGTGVPLAIVPVGTANMLAEQLGIPADPEGAMRLAAGEHRFRSIDAMELERRLYFLNAGAGVSSRTVEDLSPADKRRFGRLAYFWTGITSSLWSPPVSFRVTIDGMERDFRGIEVSVINAGFREQPGFPGVPDIEPDDGTLDVMLVWTPTPVGYLQHIGDVVAGKRPIEPNVRWMRAMRELTIDSDGVLPVQADGDIVATTPATFRVVRGAVRIAVPVEDAIGRDGDTPVVGDESGLDGGEGVR